MDANLRGYAYGLSVAKGSVVELNPPARKRVASPEPKLAPVSLTTLRDRMVRDFPVPAAEFAIEGAARTLDYQDADYAILYLNRLDRIRAAEEAARVDLEETARDTLAISRSG